MTKETVFPKEQFGSYEGGLSLRDYFAAQAINVVFEVTGATKLWTHTDFVNRAALAYKIADGMIIAREKK